LPGRKETGRKKPMKAIVAFSSAALFVTWIAGAAA
jgi:hypothetical protein